MLFFFAFEAVEDAFDFVVLLAVARALVFLVAGADAAGAVSGIVSCCAISCSVSSRMRRSSIFKKSRNR